MHFSAKSPGANGLMTNLFIGRGCFINFPLSANQLFYSSLFTEQISYPLGFLSPTAIGEDGITCGAETELCSSDETESFSDEEDDVSFAVTSWPCLALSKG